jgi:hypothetical protein
VPPVGDLYDDAGTGLGYEKGQSTQTRITTSSSTSAKGRPSVQVTVERSTGSYAGEPRYVSTTVKMVDVTRPAQVTVNGRSLGGRSWSYQSSISEVTVEVGSRPVSQTTRVVASGATVRNPT